MFYINHYINIVQWFWRQNDEMFKIKLICPKICSFVIFFSVHPFIFVCLIIKHPKQCMSSLKVCNVWCPITKYRDGAHFHILTGDNIEKIHLTLCMLRRRRERPIKDEPDGQDSNVRKNTGNSVENATLQCTLFYRDRQRWRNSIGPQLFQQNYRDFCFRCALFFF